jgi:hypothetical protein
LLQVVNVRVDVLKSVLELNNFASLGVFELVLPRNVFLAQLKKLLLEICKGGLNVDVHS